MSPLTVPPALRHRRFRLLWFGLLISVAGTRMQMAAVLWHVNELTGQPIALGGVGLVRILPVLAFSLLAGAAADAFNRRRIILFTQTGMAVLAAALGYLTLQGMDTLASIYGILALSAAVGAFDQPARHALIPNLLPPDKLANAYSLNSIANKLGAVVGPALGGLVLAYWGIAYAYLINAVSFLAVIAALLLMGRVPQGALDEDASRPPNRPLASAVLEGLRFAIRHRIIFPSMLLDFVATFFASATTLLPIFATRILGVSAVQYGWLVAASSLGSAASAGFLSFRTTVRRQGAVMVTAAVGYGLATIVFGLSRHFWLTFAALAVTGATDTLSTIIRNTIRQLQTPDQLRGRVTSVHQVFSKGGPELGELESGLLAQWLGAPLAVVSGGIGTLLVVTWVVARFPELRRYRGDYTVADAELIPVEDNGRI